jgi:hypothetical protein
MLPIAMTATHPSFVLHGPAEPRTAAGPGLARTRAATFLPTSAPRSASSSCATARTASSTSSGCRPPSAASACSRRACRAPTSTTTGTPATSTSSWSKGGKWPYEYLPSGKAELGKALIWRTLDDGQPIYARRLGVEEIHRRIERYHRPYHHALAKRIEATHARFGASWHIDCHSMNAIGGAQAEGGAGKARADMVLGDRDGTTCDPAFTEFVRAISPRRATTSRSTIPYKGVELVRAYSNPAERRMSLQLEVNKRLYMDEKTAREDRRLRRLAG